MTRDGGDQEVWELAWHGKIVYELPLKFNAREFVRMAQSESRGRWRRNAIAYHSIDREWKGPMTDSIHAAVKTDSVLIQQAIEQQSVSRLAENGHVSEAPRIGLVISVGGSRFDRVQQLLEQLGITAVQLPAVFVQNSKTCQGSNGVRRAKRNAWSLIAASNVSMGLFEDDIVLTRAHREHISTTRVRLDEAIKEHETRHGDLTFLEDGATLWWRGAAVWHSPRAARALLNLTAECNQKRAEGVDRHHSLVCSTMDCKRVRGLFVQNRSIPSYLHNRKNQYIGNRVGKWSSKVIYELDDVGVLRPTSPEER